MAGILGFRQTKERVEARLVNRGVVVEVKTQIFDRCRWCLLNCGLYTLDMQTERCINLVEVPRWRVVPIYSHQRAPEIVYESYGMELEHQLLREMRGIVGRSSWMEIDTALQVKYWHHDQAGMFSDPAAHMERNH
jgi:hypothetical protein